MSILVQVEHAVHDFDAWKAAFDRDPIDRAGSGVRRYAICRPVDDPAYVAIDLEVDDVAAARSVQEALARLWTSPVARAALAGAPRARIVEVVEQATLVGDRP